MPHLAPQRTDVPPQRPGLGHRGIGEAVYLIHADDPRLQVCQNGTAAFGSEIEREIRFPGHSDRMI